jgi:hypothetical protein
MNEWKRLLSARRESARRECRSAEDIIQSPTASKWPGGSNLGAQSTIALLLSTLSTPSPYPSFLHLAQARFLIILSTAIAACAPGLSLKALILSAMEEAPRLILAIAFTNKEEPPSSGLPLRAPPSLGSSLWALPSPSVPLWAAYTSQSGSSSILAARAPPIRSTNWQPRYAEYQAQAYSEPARVQAQSTEQAIMDLREQMEPEEKARFDRYRS